MKLNAKIRKFSTSHYLLIPFKTFRELGLEGETTCEIEINKTYDKVRKIFEFYKLQNAPIQVSMSDKTINGVVSEVNSESIMIFNKENDVSHVIPYSLITNISEVSQTIPHSLSEEDVGSLHTLAPGVPNPKLTEISV